MLKKISVVSIIVSMLITSASVKQVDAIDYLSLAKTQLGM